MTSPTPTPCPRPSPKPSGWAAATSSCRTADLTPEQLELLAQAALSHASFTVDDLAHTRHGDVPTPEQTRHVRRDSERLTDLTLITPIGDGELLVHPWLADPLTTHQPEHGRTRRHNTAARMRIHRVNTGRGRFADFVEVSRHLAIAGDYDSAVDVALQACDLVGGEVAAAALLAEIVSLIPTLHPRFFGIADRGCSALMAIGLASATADRYHTMLAAVQEAEANKPGLGSEYMVAITLERLGNLAIMTGDTRAASGYFSDSVVILDRLAATHPDDAQLQRAPSYSHNKLGDLAVAAGDTGTAGQHYRTALAIRERLAAADPGNAEYQRDLSVSHNKLGDLAVAAGDTGTAGQHYRTGLGIRERLAAADPGNAEYQRDLDYVRQRLSELTEQDQTSQPDRPRASTEDRHRATRDWPLPSPD